MKHIGLSRQADHRSEYIGDLEDAVACFDRALALKRDHSGALREKGIALAALGRHAEAAEALAEAIRLLPDDADLWLERAGALQRVGQNEEAVAACDATLRLRPGDADAIFRRAESLDALRHDAEALRAWNEVLENVQGRDVRAIGSDFRRHRTLLCRAGALARLERRPEAIDAYRKSINEGAALDMSASEQFSEALADVEAARDAYQAYLAENAENPQIWRKAGENFLRAQRATDALTAYEHAIRLEPAQADGWVGKAEALVQSGRRVEAIHSYREALRVKPGYLAASLRLQRVQRDIGRSQSDAKEGS